MSREPLAPAVVDAVFGSFVSVSGTHVSATAVQHKISLVINAIAIRVVETKPLVTTELLQKPRRSMLRGEPK